MRLRVVLETAATILVALVWFFLLRPVALGGPASYIVVRGYSMSGTLAPGDLVVTIAQGSYAVGDAIVYHVPTGAGRGLLVVHRIVSADPSGYRMQGDANSYQDPWRPKISNVVGRLVLTLPGFGRVVTWMINPFVLGTVWGLVALIVGLSFLPDSPAPKPELPTTPKPPKRGSTDHPALDVTIGLAVGLMIGLVMLSAEAVFSPAHAAGLTVHNDLLTARVGQCPPPPPFGAACP
jgi:signal peptidase